LAAILVELKAPLVLEEVDVPRPVLGQVLVKVLCSGICGSQLGEIAGVKGPDPYLPHLLGHEGTGLVVECGEGVTTVRPGDRVVLHWRPGAGLESVVPRYGSRLGPVNAGRVTTFNEYAIVSENRVTAIPAGFDPELACLLGCAVTTGFGVVNNNARVRIGESVAVFGAGGVGLSIVQAAALVAAHPIVAIDLFENRLELAGRLGATHTINAAREDVETAIRDLLGKAGLDVAIDNTGNPRVIEAAYRLTSARGRTVLVGVPPRDSTASIYTLPLHFEKILTGSHGGESRPAVDIPRYVRLCESGKLDLQPCLGKRYDLTQINQAIEEMRSGVLAGRAVLHMTSARNVLPSN
jgi:S-(hydroxymethyl)glutathione dehydrogenase/alcohol dehydrogenase